MIQILYYKVIEGPEEPGRDQIVTSYEGHTKDFALIFGKVLHYLPLISLWFETTHGQYCSAPIWQRWEL